MGFLINKSINTKLSFDEVALIAVACGEYQRLYKDSASKEVLRNMKNLIDRLGRELANHSGNEKANGH